MVVLSNLKALVELQDACQSLKFIQIKSLILHLTFTSFLSTSTKKVQSDVLPGTMPPPSTRAISIPKLPGLQVRHIHVRHHLIMEKNLQWATKQLHCKLNPQYYPKANAHVRTEQS